MKIVMTSFQPWIPVASGTAMKQSRATRRIALQAGTPMAEKWLHARCGIGNRDTVVRLSQTTQVTVHVDPQDLGVGHWRVSVKNTSTSNV